MAAASRLQNSDESAAWPEYVAREREGWGQGCVECKQGAESCRRKLTARAAGVGAAWEEGEGRDEVAEEGKGLAEEGKVWAEAGGSRPEEAGRRH